MSSKTRPAISPNAVYRMDVQGVVLSTLQRTLFVRADGEFVVCTVSTHNGTARLGWRLIKRGSWRARLARRLLGVQ